MVVDNSRVISLVTLAIFFSISDSFSSYSSTRISSSINDFRISDNLSLFEGNTFLTFVSSNSLKIREVKAILGESFPWELRCENANLDELQATPIEVSQNKCIQAANLFEGPVIVEDTSLCFNALQGLPGPYIKWFYEGIGNEGLAKLLDGFDDKSAYAQCVLSFSLGKGEEVKTFVGSVDGTIVSPTGPKGFGWDPIFMPLGSDKTFAEMDSERKNKLSHRYKAFQQFKAYINQRTGS